MLHLKVTVEILELVYYFQFPASTPYSDILKKIGDYLGPIIDGQLHLFLKTRYPNLSQNYKRLKEYKRLRHIKLITIDFINIIDL